MSLLVGDVSIAEKVFSLTFRFKPAARGHHAVVSMRDIRGT
jgi:hypothetical protein